MDITILKCSDHSTICVGIDSSNKFPINSNFSNQITNPLYACSANGIKIDQRLVTFSDDLKFGEGDTIKLVLHTWDKKLNFCTNDQHVHTCNKI